MNAWHNLKQIARNNKARLIGTFTLVLAENLLLLTYPVFGGFAINGVLEGNLGKALSYAAVILVIWTVGSVRRAGRSIPAPLAAFMRRWWCLSFCNSAGMARRFPPFPRVRRYRASWSISLKCICQLW